MKPASSALETLLETGNFAQFELYTLTYFGGGVLRITNCQVDVLADLYSLADLYAAGDLYSDLRWLSRGLRVDPRGSRSTYSQKIGLDVDTWSLTVMPRIIDPITGETYPDKIGSTPWVAAAAAGALDNAQLTVDRAYFATAPSLPLTAGNAAAPVGIIRLFSGLVGAVDVADTTVSIAAMDYRSLLSTKIPPNVFQAGCQHTLFDAGCQLVASAFAVAGSAIGGTTQGSIASAAQPPAGSSGTFALGRVVMTSGLNNTFARAVRSWDGVRMSLMMPFPFAVTAGDTFLAYPGCDKTQPTCALFTNTLNFGGQPDIPTPETVL